MIDHHGRLLDPMLEAEDYPMEVTPECHEMSLADRHIKGIMDIEDKRVLDAINRPIEPGRVKYVRSWVLPKPWWVRILELLRLRRVVYEVSHQFEIQPKED
jgi:hypothetical protein